jgi:hypothetical protein
MTRSMRGKKIRYIRFSLKSFKPASCLSDGPLDSAGSQPMMVPESGVGGGDERNDSAKAGKEDDAGVGGSTRW